MRETLEGQENEKCGRFEGLMRCGRHWRVRRCERDTGGSGKMRNAGDARGREDSGRTSSTGDSAGRRDLVDLRDA